MEREGQRGRNRPGTPSDDPEVVDLTARVRAIVRAKTLEAMLEVGELLYERCYGGTGTADDEDNPTINAISRQPDPPLSRTALYRAVRIYLQYPTLPAGLRDDLRLSQHYEILPLPAGPEKDAIVADVVATDQPVRQTRLEVADAVSGKGSDAPQRASLPPVAAATGLLTRWRGTASERPAAEDVARIRREIAELREFLDDLEAWLR